MKWTPWLFGSLTAVLIAGCGGERRNSETGTTGGAEAESGTMQGGAGTATDTALGSTDTTGSVPSKGDTIRSGRDSVPSPNQ
jgi:hypothetical protein